MRNHIAKVLGIFWILTLSIPTAWASETYGSSSEDWSFTLMPYIWGTSLKGTTAPLPPLPAIEVDASFGDIIDEINLGFMGAAELRKGKFGIIADVLWLDISTESPGPLSLIKVDAATVTATLLGAYRVLEQEQGWLDLVVGARGYYVDTDLDVGPGGIFFSTDHTEGWVDAMGGIRALINLGKGFYATALAIGGGGGSRGAVDVVGKVGYMFKDHISVFAGYRYIKVDYQNRGFGWDVELQGPLMGGTYKF